MRLHNLKPRPGAKHRKKRVGRGESSGLGKTSGRGHKGQMSRAGGSTRVGFEGGQMPLIRRLPKRGFNNFNHSIRYIPVNLSMLNSFNDGETVELEDLRNSGLANGPIKLIKILGNGEINKKLTVKAHKFSSMAKAKIQKAGGSCEEIAASSSGKFQG